MNENFQKAINVLVVNIEARKQSEKVLILGMVVACLVLAYLTFAFDPVRGAIDSSRIQIANVERQILNQQNAYQDMVLQSQEDPNLFANDRLNSVLSAEAELDLQIQALAGDLVTPNQMTEILTTVLERFVGLELVSFQNRNAEPLREGIAEVSSPIDNDGIEENNSEVVGQVYSHGLSIEFEGDYFSTLKYLRFLEELSGSFFWDSIRFNQLEWPAARVSLQIHTLSTDQGFIGV